jgi:outer membrane PBP1 activator LpoA protein
MMNTMNVMFQSVQRIGVACFFVAAVILMGCSSAPEPQPEPSKKEVQQDADRFFNKMKQEEGAQSPSQK